MIKKSLGQNFFVNENLGKQIIQYVENDNPDVIVEIGPGRGFFTKKLSTLAPNIILVEKDDDLALQLQEEFSNINVLNEDFLDWDMKKLEQFNKKRIVFFGSLPYNVSKPIIHKIISSPFFNSNSYFIIQKEVAEKYTSNIPNNNILSLKTQLFANIKKILDINPGSFLPRPKVNSSLVKLSPITSSYENINYEKFITFIEQCFKSPRKTLRNNLKGREINPKNEQLMSKRPSELTLDQYLDIFTNFS